jgi:drug/metabolite transporter (DMT)-like permease
MDIPATMSPGVFAAVLAAAALHAGWNAFLKVKLEPFLAMTLITGSGGVVGIPLLLAFGFPRLEAWPWLMGSVVIHLGYYFALTEAYRRADMGQIYPIARGGAPLLTASISVGLLHEAIGLQAALGIAVLGCGIILIAFLGRRRQAAFDPHALGFALLTAGIVCAYTIVDGLGARIAGDPHAYSAALFVIDGIPLVLVAFWLRGFSGLAPMRQFLGRGIAGGAMSLGAYWIAIWAMTVAPIALVAALRETSVLWASLIAVLFLKEPFIPARAVAAALIVAGVALIRLQ